MKAPIRIGMNQLGQLLVCTKHRGMGRGTDAKVSPPSASWLMKVMQSPAPGCTSLGGKTVRSNRLEKIILRCFKTISSHWS